jgi:hypothetical protein
VLFGTVSESTISKFRPVNTPIKKFGRFGQFSNNTEAAFQDTIATAAKDRFKRY